MLPVIAIGVEIIENVVIFFYQKINNFMEKQLK